MLGSNQQPPPCRGRTSLKTEASSGSGKYWFAGILTSWRFGFGPSIRPVSRPRCAQFVRSPGRAAPAAATSCASATIDGMSASVLAELSYDAGLRGLELQERGLEQLRARTGILLAASSLTASFLGAQTIQHESGMSVL